jgi:hypothetical protein
MPNRFATSGDNYTPVSESYLRTRSVSRAPSMSNYYKSNNSVPSGYRARMHSIDRDYVVNITNSINFNYAFHMHSIWNLNKDTSSKLDNANKGYHDMHGSFLGKRWENKHVLYGIQDHVCCLFFLLQILHT